MVFFYPEALLAQESEAWASENQVQIQIKSIVHLST